MFRSIAIVNRGEAAVRFIRAAREYADERGVELECVALCTPPDRGALFTRLADRVLDLPIPEGGGAVQAYLNHAGVIDTMTAAGCDAVWVGWGFVAEDPAFAQACLDANLVFLGPPPSAMRLAADKIEAKKLAERCNVPVVPWSGRPLESLDEVREVADRLGFPLALKATAGGGGRGIRMVHSADALDAAFHSASREAERAFGDGRLFVERCVQSARHVEVQVAVGADGRGQAFGVRDCTVQRRHQKLIEESPGPFVTPTMVADLEAGALRFAEGAGYVGVGTVEFIADPETGECWLMEMNGRLQVEHPVSELCYGVDLVKVQIDIARGLPVPEAASPRGAAVEVRLNAEDPDRDYAPSPGRVTRFHVPQGPGLRVDSGIEAGDTIPPDFDSNIAKILAWGSTRREAFARLRRALDEIVVSVRDGATNRRLLRELLDDPAVIEGTADTRWLDTRPQGDGDTHAGAALLVAAVFAYREEGAQALRGFYEAIARGVPQNLPEAEGREVRVAGRPLTVYCTAYNHYEVRSADGAGVDVVLHIDEPGAGQVEVAGHKHQMLYHLDPTTIEVELDGYVHRIGRHSGGLVRSPAPALVMDVAVEEGQFIEAGQPLCTLEAMKMEMPLFAPSSGRVVTVYRTAGAQVAAGHPLVLIEAEGADAQAAAGPELPAGIPTTGRLTTMAAVVAEARRVLLGYDADPERIEAVFAILDDASLNDGVDGHRPPASDTDQTGPLADLLSAFVDIERVFDTDLTDGEPGLGRTSNRTGFYQLARMPSGGSDALRATVLEAAQHYGLSELESGTHLRHVLGRIAVASGRGGDRTALRHRLANSVLRRLMRLHHAGVDFTGNDRLRLVLEELPNRAHSRWPFVADNAARVRYALFHAPPRDPPVDALLESNDLEALVTTPHSKSAELARATRGDHPRRAALALMRRIYAAPENAARIREASSPKPDAWWVELDRPTSTPVVGLVGDTAGLTHLLDGAAARHTSDEPLCVDLIIHPAAGERRNDIAAAVASALRVEHGERIERVCVMVVNGDPLLPHTTWRFEDGAWVEQPRLRDLHPEMARHLQIWRLSEFELTRVASHDRLAIYHATARANPKDERLIVTGEVRDVPDGEMLSSAPTALLGFEHAFVEAMQGLRAIQSQRDPRGRLRHNQVILHVRPVAALAVDMLYKVADRLVPHTHGLGLERVVVYVRLAQGGGEPQPLEVCFTNPTGHQMRLEVNPQSDTPMPAATPYELRAALARARGVAYPYEVLGMLTSSKGSPAGREVRFPRGRFQEYELEGETYAPTTRRRGKNVAGVVFGLITHHTKKHPLESGGLRRVIILSDPLKAMGALSEPECRRILAAIDLAEQEQLPIEWLTTSAGALISMDSGTENLDWTARVLRRIIGFTQAGGMINVLLDGVCVGAQSYFNAEATMLMHTRGVLIMTPGGSMVLTGKRALDASGAVSAEDERGIGGYERIMGPNGQAQYLAPDLAHAFALLLEHYEYSYVAPGEAGVRQRQSKDPVDRDVTQAAYSADGFDTIGDIFGAGNADRKRPFAIREVMAAVADTDGGALERWQDQRHADTAVVWDTHLGGHAVTLIGIESQPVVRVGFVPSDGPESWSGGTLFPGSSRKVARAINAASGCRPVVVLANLSGFDGSPESMRKLQLEYGAEIGRAVVDFDGPLVFCVVGRYHGGAYVVFSKALNPNLTSLAVDGSFASVIGGAPAAAVVFPREVRGRTNTDPRVVEAREALGNAPLEDRPRLAEELTRLIQRVHTEKQAEVAREFDAVHSVHRAKAVGSLDDVIAAREIRPRIIAALTQTGRSK